ncbi:MAG: hypothetical protein ACHQC8_02425 [Solirubrobacterales bacterium]
MMSLHPMPSPQFPDRGSRDETGPFAVTIPPTTDFEQAVLTMLRNEGLDDTQIAPIFNDIVTQMWANQSLRQQYDHMVYPADIAQTPATPAQLAAEFTKLFDAQPQFSPILDTILQYKLDQGIPLTPADEKRLGGVLAGSTAAQTYANYGIYNRTDLVIYAPIATLWKQVFGRDPTSAELQDVISHGTSEAQYEDYVRGMQLGRIPGITVGQYLDTRAAADKISTALYGHPSNDGIVTELFNAGMMSTQAIQTWYDNIESQTQATKDKTLYNTAYAALAPQTQAVFNQAPDPRVVAGLIQYGLGQQPPTATPAAASVPATTAAEAAQKLPVAP